VSEQLDTPRWGPLFVGLAVLGLVLLRLVELRTVVHLLYSPELYGLGSFAWEVHEGTVPPDLSLFEWLSRYQYMRFAQGTVMVQLAAVLAVAATGPSTLAFHAIGIAFEALTVGVLASLASRLGRVVGAAMILPWLFAPVFVVAWQLMPYGNHTEFLAAPLLMLGVAVRTKPMGRSGLIALGFLVMASVISYRPNAAAAIALAGVLGIRALRGERRPLSAVLAGLLTAVLIIAGLSAAWSGPVLGGDEGAALLPRLTLDRYGGLGVASEAWRGVPRFFASSASLGGVTVGMLALGPALALFAIAKKRTAAPGALFGVLWFVLAAVPPVLFAPPHPEYLLQAFYAALTCLLAAALSVPRTRFPAAGIALLLACTAISDLGRLVDPSSWETTEEHEGFRYSTELALFQVDVDEIPHWTSILDGGADPWVGFASSTVAAGCLPQPLRNSPEALGSAKVPRCTGWPRGGLARHIEDRKATGAPISTQDLWNLGRGAWVVCDRDLDRVRLALEGLDPGAQRHVLEGARVEAKRWANRSQR
jgi:hypothetical protein